MPTQPITAALLSAAKDDQKTPWDSKTWQDITGIECPPWTQVDLREAPRWGVEVANKVFAFAENFWRKDPSYIKKTADNDAEGRNAWVNMVTNQWGAWKINGIIDRVMAENGMDPWTIMKEWGLTELPDLENAGVRTLFPIVGEELFGLDCFIDPHNPKCLKPRYRELISVFLATTWKRLGKGISRERNGMDKNRRVLDKLWDEISKEGAAPTSQQIRTYSTKLDKLVAKLKRYGDAETVAELEKFKERLQALLSGLELDVGGCDKTRLPLVVRQALKLMASEDRVRDLQTTLMESLAKLIDEEDPDNMPALDFTEASSIEWKEGVEYLQHVSVDRLWEWLGDESKQLPFINTVHDPDGIRDPWLEEDKAWFAEPENTEPFGPKWHQLVGLFWLLERAFEGKNGLNMDEVGLGKTLQAVSLIAKLTQMQAYFEQRNQFPGRFANLSWQGKIGENIPNEPWLVVVPVNLIHQYIAEFHRYLEPQSFDILLCVGTFKSRQGWMDDIYMKSNHKPSRRIIIATTTALQSDYDAVFHVMTKKQPNKEPSMTTAAIETQPRTLYGLAYAGIVVDEAHGARNVGRQYSAFYQARTLSAFMVALTATPVTTRPLDAWNLGRILGIERFNDADACEMGKEINSAMRRDRKARQDVDTKDEIKRVSAGQEGANIPNTDFQNVTIKWMKEIRTRFTGQVIRRTASSKDFQGNLIVGLPPYIDRDLRLDLYPHELDHIEELAGGLAEESAGVSPAMARAGGKNFYLEIRRALTHPKCSKNWSGPQNLEEWEKTKSKKLETLATLIKHHLADDNAPTVTIVNNQIVSDCPETTNGQTAATSGDESVSNGDQANQTPSSIAPPPVELNQPPPSTNPPLPSANLPPKPATPTKIAVYNPFPADNDLVRKVLKLHDIICLQVHGHMKPKGRNAAIAAFKASDRKGPRVLLLSQVGLTGLNLPVAHILIMLGTLWSAQDDRQLIGRVWRQPQKKTVVVYRLIANRTSDVFLNNISFDKGTMFDAFTNSLPKLRSLFDKDANNNYDVEQVERSSSSYSEPGFKEGERRVPAKTRGKGKISAASLEKAPAPATAPKKALAAASKKGETSAKGKKKNTSAASSTKAVDKPPQRGSAKTGEENRVRLGTPMDVDQTSGNTGTTLETAADTTVVKPIKPRTQPKEKTKQPAIDCDTPAVRPSLSNNVTESQPLPPSPPSRVDALPPPPVDTNPPPTIGSPPPPPDESPPLTPIDSPPVAPSFTPPSTPNLISSFARFTERTGMALPPWQPATANSTSGPSTDDAPMHSDNDRIALGKRTDRSPSTTKNDPTGKRKRRSEAQRPHVQASAHVTSILGLVYQQDEFGSLPGLPVHPEGKPAKTTKPLGE